MTSSRSYCPVVIDPHPLQPNPTYNFALPWYGGKNPPASVYVAAADKLTVAQAIVELNKRSHPLEAQTALFKKVLDQGSAQEFDSVLQYFNPAQPVEQVDSFGTDRYLPLRYYLSRLTGSNRLPDSPQEQRVKVLLLLQRAIPEDLYSCAEMRYIDSGLYSLVQSELYRRDLILTFAALLELSRNIGLDLALLQNNVRLGGTLNPQQVQQLILTEMAAAFNLDTVQYLLRLYPDQLPEPDQLLDLLFKDEPAVKKNSNLIKCFRDDVFSNLTQDDYLQRAIDNDDSVSYEVLSQLSDSDDQ